MVEREDFIRNFPVTIDVDVQWGEMDAFGHVNNVIYYRYFESARIAYMRHISEKGVFDLGRIVPVLAESSCRYLRPVRYPDTLTVGCTITEMQEFGFAQEYEIYSAVQGIVVTTGVARVVLLDKHSKQKALLAPELHEEIKLLEALA